MRAEIGAQLEEFGNDKFQYMDKLNSGKLDSATFKTTKQFLSTMKRVHLARHKKAQLAKEKRIKEMTSSPKKVEAFNRLKRDFTNDQITSMVFDNKEKTRILEHKGRLIQQIYPIFSDPNPSNYFDFRALFYLPIKHFAGRYYETLYFNVVIMWLMSLVLVVTLYFDVLKKIINLEERFKSKSK